MEETRKLGERDKEKVGRLFVECIEEMISILDDRLLPQTDKREGDRISKQC